MTGRVEGKVAFITGAARGQGRSHAVRLAQEGADIIAIDLMDEIAGAPYEAATEEDMAETVRQVEALDRRIVATRADVRDYDALKAAVDDGVAQLGRLDIVSANAGIVNETQPTTELSEAMWLDMIDINLNGVWRTCKVAIPHLKAAGGGSMILTSSVAGLKAMGNIAHYVAAKHGVVGLMKSLAIELAPDMIRVNSVHPTQVDTKMIMNDGVMALFGAEAGGDPMAAFAAISTQMNTLPIPWVDPVDISNAVLWLASDEARYVTGIALPVDAGALLK